MIATLAPLAIRVTGVRFDPSLNKTFAIVHTREFTAHMHVSGYVEADQFADWVWPTVERMHADGVA
jgi:hypothetical protein